MTVLWLIIAGLAALVALVDLAHGVAARSDTGRPPAGGGPPSEAIIVLGYPSRGNQAHPIQRWRCQIAVRSMCSGQSSLLIMTGSSGDGKSRSEAAVMSDYTHDVLGVPAKQIVLEERAKTTWENMVYSLPLAERFAVIKIASDPLHARRARRYIAEIRPDLMSRLAPAATYRPFEHPVLKTGTLVYEARLAARRRLGALRGARDMHESPSQAQETTHDPTSRNS